MKKYLYTFLKGILAGISIGVGGFLYVLMTYTFQGSLSELGKIFGSLLFSIGLFTVCSFSLSLYTGKIGLIFEKKQDKDFYISLPIMLVGNALGAFLLGYICYFSFRNTELFQYAYNTANVRLVFNDAFDYITTVIKGMLCGLCVYLAVKSFNYNRLKPLGITLLVAFVFIFVYSGFQHCIANMFYFGFANTMNYLTVINLVLVIVSNSIGPIIGVGLLKVIEKQK